MVGAPEPSGLAPHGSRMETGGGRCRRYWRHPLGAPLSTSSASVVAAAGPAASTLRGPAIDVFSFGGSRCQPCRQHPPRGPPSTSSTSVVAAAGPAASTPRGPPSTSPTSVVAAARHVSSTPQGAHHRRLQLWWWPLLDLPAAPPRGSAIDAFNFGGGRYRTCHQPIDVSNFGGGRCRTYRQHPPGAPPSTSPTSVVAPAGPAGSTPQGARRQLVS
jgi:hypothetical protein